MALALAAGLLLTGASDPVLVPEVSQHAVRVRQGFTGAELLLFGAITTPEGMRIAPDYDIVVVVKGPVESIRLREKRRVAGIWVNSTSTGFRSAPSFYALASTRPVRDLVDERTAAIYELGLSSLQLSPIGAINPAEQARFSAGLVDLKRRQGLYAEDPHGVRMRGQVLYQARIDLPSNVLTGRYTAETFAIRKGRVVTSAISEIAVRKEGFELLVANAAENDGLWYGLLAVALSVGMGWAAGRLFALG